MNENREISAQSQRNFRFLSHFNSKTTGLIFTTFSHDVQKLVELLMHISAKQWCILLQNTRAESKERRQLILTSAKIPPKINWLP